jgi:hypothetical protein
MRHAVALLGLTLAVAAIGAPKPPAPALPAPPMTPGAPWCLALAGAPALSFHGVDALDERPFAPGAMMYPAPSAIVALAALATHAAVMGGVRSKAERDRVAAADKVLEPYRPVLASFGADELSARTLAAHAADPSPPLACAAPADEAAWVVEASPGFGITQGQSTLLVENLVVLHPPKATAASVHRVRVKVIGRELDAPDPRMRWLLDDGYHLKAECAALFDASLAVALRIAGGATVGADAPAKTFRYREDGDERFERAQLVEESCDRLLLKTLRGAYLSVPVKEPSCIPGTLASAPQSHE